ncbi:MAG TPA: hypothetical protein H9836_01230 [Candidatus Nocardiopsis merdipullorum]|nr:hypothetical protein [Candidatus Nocardiopsis merdipullorum]
MGLLKQSTKQTDEKLEADKRQAERLPDLLRSVSETQIALRKAEQSNAPVEELRRLDLELDEVLTEAMRAAYAEKRLLIGPKGYTDRIYRRKRLAKPAVREVLDTAERLLTAREEHRLHGIRRFPLSRV